MTKEEAFIKYKEIFDFAETGKQIEDVINVEELMVTPAAPSIDTGLAYDGSMMFHTIMVWHFAKKLLPLFENIGSVDVKSLAKVVALYQIGKIGMFVQNTNDWEIKKLGKVFTFNNSDACLKNGELSKLYASNAGITFTKQEYEAMSIMDKTPEEYENMSKYRTNLSTILKMANDLAYTVARERHKKTLTNE